MQRLKFHPISSHPIANQPPLLFFYSHFDFPPLIRMSSWPILISISIGDKKSSDERKEKPGILLMHFLEPRMIQYYSNIEDTANRIKRTEKISVSRLTDRRVL